MSPPTSSLTSDASISDIAIGDALEVEWPCLPDEAAAPADGSPSQPTKVWFDVVVVDIKVTSKTKFLLKFADGGECWNSLRELAWRPIQKAAGPRSTAPGDGGSGGEVEEAELPDSTGFVHRFVLDDELLRFCDELYLEREALGDRTRGDCAYGEPLSGGLKSVLIRRDALSQEDKARYNALHQRCISEVPIAWPSWLRKAGGPNCRARPSQDLRILEYSEGANFKEHVDSAWACQALIYLNEDFEGGFTAFPNLPASYKPRRGTVLLWRSVSVGHKAAVPGSMQDHPALHVARPVTNGTKRVVSIHLVLA